MILVLFYYLFELCILPAREAQDDLMKTKDELFMVKYNHATQDNKQTALLSELLHSHDKSVVCSLTTSLWSKVGL